MEDIHDDDDDALVAVDPASTYHSVVHDDEENHSIWSSSVLELPDFYY